MYTQTVGEQVRWQDLKVRSELDIVLEIANEAGWQDCEVFGSGDMITQPQESMGWKLIPADQYKYSIPSEAVTRLHRIINAGVRVRGVIIADDERRTEPPPAPARLDALLSALKTVVSSIGEALLRVLRVVGVIALVSIFTGLLIHFGPTALLGVLAVFVLGAGSEYDPKLVALVDDGKGGTAWVSLFTWYD